MIAKSLTGISFFDERYGGTYRGRAILVTGRAGTGKSILGLQFVAQGLKQGERCLLLSAQPAADVLIYASAFGIAVDQAVEGGNLIVLEYSDYVPGRDREETLTLPSEGFVQLQEIIDSNAIQRVVLDTALPWVVTRSQDHLAEHVFSFVRAFDRLGCTTLLTMPKPVSPASFKLKNALEDVVPVSVTLSMDPGSDSRTWIVTKYLGEKRMDQGTEYVLAPGLGFQRAADVAPPAPTPAPTPVPAPPPPVQVAPAPPAQAPVPFIYGQPAAAYAPPPPPAYAPPYAPPPPAPVPAEASAPTAADGMKGKIRFAGVMLGNGASTPPGRAQDRSFRWGATMNR